MFFPVDQQYSVTDGTAAPGNHGAPANLRNFTPYHRSGGDISVAHATFMRGQAGRAAGEKGYLRRYQVEISALTVEQDDEALVGPTVLFDMGDARTANQRIYQRQYASGHTRTVNCLVENVGDGYQADDVMQMPVTLGASGTLTEVGFALLFAVVPLLGFLA